MYTYYAPVNKETKDYNEIAAEIRSLMRRLVPSPSANGMRIHNLGRKNVIPGEITAVLLGPDENIKIGLLAVHIQDPTNVGGNPLYGSIRWCRPNYEGLHAAWDLLTLEAEKNLH